mmetsp:Transcript_2361/g.3937  ORF Transcript_2361/g.3937 Transcript_2361/m.3937 type:complete len:175 (+) Transcript_2361:45-569(+)|eukprot:CAMPEP_0119109366 /NCGR_PEP_ID=MMETSP1180-20130426/17869_1 /TAXON_ID=3052 ORGANISM="Chlamydomonas cf sp, Strain CCMP681" /NCGR_SAMPLE_ID=MMETSP1180 /ASSEMBLY_ACC=CAM_ASM_000741 /LENGTH=174 /DNA_ID=CAMNT_0007095113 /DNA_START=45 /DNA_END=569 /DNA_ORIENTATION=+
MQCLAQSATGASLPPVAPTRMAPCRPLVKPFSPAPTHQFNIRMSSAQPQHRCVQARFFMTKNKNDYGGAADAGKSRGDYDHEDVAQYFEFMGILAQERTYDSMDAMFASGLKAVDVLLLLACAEGDVSTAREVLNAGADVHVKRHDGASTMQLAAKPEMQALIQYFMSKEVVLK